VRFADESEEPPLDTLYQHLYVVSETMGWYAVDERSPDPHPGEREAEASQRAKDLAEAGAAYAGVPSGPRINPAEQGDAREGAESRGREDAEEGQPQAEGEDPEEKS
jgi:hypothetical protein